MRRNGMMRLMADVASRTGEPILQQPLLELCGERRVLIENHKGIGEYSSQLISVSVKFGVIVISGTGLEICKMTAEQLVITGNIESISLLKGRGI